RRDGNCRGFGGAPAGSLDQILEMVGQFCGEVLQPLNLPGDQEGCHFDKASASVTTPKGFKEAYKQFCELGLPGLTGDPNYGGQGLPHVVGLVTSEMATAANQSFSMYPGLSHGAYEAIHHWGTEEQKQTWLPKLVTGEGSGTMNLTEPHCGTDLGLMRTRAEPQADGSYKITGTKIFISAGEHDLTSNIVHL